MNETALRKQMDLKPYLYTLLVISYLIFVIWPSQSLQYAVGCIAILCVSISFRGAKRLFQTVGALFLSAGAILVWAAGMPLREVPMYMSSNVLLLSLLYMLPWINHVFRVGGYDRHLNQWLSLRTRHLGQLYYRTEWVSFGLSLFLFFGSIPLVYEVLKKNLAKVEEETAKKFAARAVLRGFGMVGLWSPVEPLVAMAVQITSVPYLHLMPWTLLLSVLLLLIDGALGWRYRKVALAPAEGTATSTERPSLRKTAALLLALILFIGSISALHSWSGLSFFASVSFVILPFTFIWALLIKRVRSFWVLSVHQWRTRTGALQNFMILFLSFGFFNSVAAKTPLLQMLEQPVLALADKPVLLFLAILLISLLMPLIGFHPLVTMSLLGIFLAPVLEQISPLSLCIVLISSNLASSFMGTFNTTVTIMGGLLKVNPYRITAWNIGFVFIFGGLGIVLALFLMI